MPEADSVRMFTNHCVWFYFIILKRQNKNQNYRRRFRAEVFYFRSCRTPSQKIRWGMGRGLKKKVSGKKISKSKSGFFDILPNFYFFLLDCSITLTVTHKSSVAILYNRYRFQCRTVPGTGCWKRTRNPFQVRCRHWQERSKIKSVSERRWLPRSWSIALAPRPEAQFWSISPEPVEIIFEKQNSLCMDAGGDSPPQAENFGDFRIQSRSPRANPTFPSNVFGPKIPKIFRLRRAV